MARWRWLIHDLRSNAFVAELPLSVTTCGVRMPPGVGDFAAMLDIEDERVRKMNWRAAVEPRRNVAYAEYNGDDGSSFLLDTCWVLWDHIYHPDTQQVELRGTEIWNYYHKRNLSAPYTFTSEDQLDIARQLMLTESAQEGGASAYLQIDPVGAVPLSGVLRDHQYDANIDLAQQIEDLSALIDGFDLRIDVYRDSFGVIQRRLLLGYPNLGVSDTGLSFTMPGNIVSLEWPVTGSVSANRITATSDASPLIAVATDTDQLNAGYALLEKVSQYSGVTDITTLQGHADADLAMLSDPVPIPTIKVKSDAYPKLGTYSLGDSVHIQLQDDIYFCDGFEIDAVWRVIGYDPDIGGAQTSILLNSPAGMLARLAAA